MSPDTTFRQNMVSLASRAMLLLGVAAACGAMANLAGPRRIAWAEDWSLYVEAMAYKEGLAVADLDYIARSSETGSRLIFDARSAADYAAGHIPGSLSLSFENVEDEIEQFEPLLSPVEPVITYCSDTACDDALMLALYLREQGFTNVSLFVGGWAEWIEANPTGEVAP